MSPPVVCEVYQFAGGGEQQQAKGGASGFIAK